MYLSLLYDYLLQSKFLNVFKDSPEFGWTEVKRDVRRHIFIKNRTYGAVNSAKSYACALKGDGKIDKNDTLLIVLYMPINALYSLRSHLNSFNASRSVIWSISRWSGLNWREMRSEREKLRHFSCLASIRRVLII